MEKDLSAEQWRLLLAGPPGDLAKALFGAAEAGDPLAQLIYGQCLLDGNGVAADAQAAFLHFHRAAQAGLAEAMNMVGRCFDQGWGVPVLPEEAARWFERAAEADLDWGLYNFATMLALGRGVAMDRERALGLFRRAASRGHAKSANMVGSFHEDGWSVPVNRALAAYHYARAAEGGDFRGAFNHARMLAEDGKADKALHWLDRARDLAQSCGNVRFLGQMGAWLAGREEAEFRALSAEFKEFSSKSDEGFTHNFETANDSQ